ncbi:MAG: tetratricopeptide repeat protein [Phycisphaerales bacterium]|nr:tetratricopeptide repeat protein [Phycisphaerales bacterium]
MTLRVNRVTSAPGLRRLGACGVLAVASLVGCAGHTSPPSNDDAAARRAEAMRLLAEAQKAQNAGKLTEAQDLYVDALKLEPSAGAGWNNLGLVFMKQGKALEAAEAFKQAADRLPGDPRPYENLGLLYGERSHADDSLKYYMLSLERDPNWLPSLRGMSLQTRKLGRADHTILDALDRAVMLENDSGWKPVIERERMRVRAMVDAREKSDK